MILFDTVPTVHGQINPIVVCTPSPSLIFRRVIVGESWWSLMLKFYCVNPYQIDFSFVFSREILEPVRLAC